MSKPSLKDCLLPGLPRKKILDRYRRSPGNEIDSGKFASVESSAALAANAFGFFMDQPERLPPLPGTESWGWPAKSMILEECCPFPWWPRGRHPWLDVFIETTTHIIGIESKRFEPYRAKTEGTFSKTYWREVWGNRMGPFELMRDRLCTREFGFERLDAVQLVKHAFGLVTEAGRRGKEPALVYLYAEPDHWPRGGRSIPPAARERHAHEVQRFAREVSGAAVAFQACTYAKLLASFRRCGDASVRLHADDVAEAFGPLGENEHG